MSNIDSISPKLTGSNTFYDGLDSYRLRDKHLIDLRKYKYVHQFDWWRGLSEPSINMLYGGRQIGKTTSIKLYIENLIAKQAVAPTQIIFIPCDNILDRDELYRIILRFLESVDANQQNYIFIDEVTFIKDWHLTIKGLIDSGEFAKSLVVVTGSDSIVLEDAAASFPGINRRGRNAKDVALHPLSFNQFVRLIRPRLLENDRSADNASFFAELGECFNSFLQCGGFPVAINEYMETGVITRSTKLVYQQWIVHDFTKHGKDKKKLVELFAVLASRVATQVSFRGLAQGTNNLSVDLVIEYLNHLERIGVLKVLSAFDQNKFSPFPRKAKKIHFQDPFICSTVLDWLKTEQLISEQYEINQSLLVEAVVAAHYARKYPVYYIKADGEVDLVFIANGKFFPVEVKWGGQINSKDLKQIGKYENGLILSKSAQTGKIGGVSSQPLVKNLLALGIQS